MDLSANKVNSTSQSIKIDKLNSSEWNQLVTEYNNVLSKAGITPSSSDLTQFKSAVEEIFDETYELEEENDGWVKPSDWIDIRSGALSNSVYFLVAHSAHTGTAGSYTVATYPQFVFSSKIENNGTYDVFVDGMKISTANSNTITTIDWATLYNNGTLVGGFDVTYPSTLTTHVVRLSASNNSNAIIDFNPVITDGYDAPQMGVMWCHITVATALSFHFGSAYKNVQPILESITGVNDVILCKDCAQIARNCWELKHIDTLDFAADIDPWTTNHFQGQFHGCMKLKKLSLKNIKEDKTNGDWYTFSDSVFDDCSSLQKIEAENVIMNVSNGMFYNNGLLKSIAGIQFGPMAEETVLNIFKGCTSLDDTFLDFSNYNMIKRLVLNGDSSRPVNGIKGLTVSNEAPFDNDTSPQLDVSYTGLDKQALVSLFESMPTVTNNQICSIVCCTGTPYLTQEDKNIVLNKGWQLTVQ